MEMETSFKVPEWSLDDNTGANVLNCSFLNLEMRDFGSRFSNGKL